MKKKYTEQILEYMRSGNYVPVQRRQLGRAVGIARGEYAQFSRAVDKLERTGRIERGEHSILQLPTVAKTVEGTYSAKRQGFGFVIPDAQTKCDDLYVAQRDSLNAITGDRVLCEVRENRKKGEARLRGRIVEVIKRGRSQFVGELRRDGDNWSVLTDADMLHGPILIGDLGGKSCRAGDKVVVELTRYPSEGETARGVIVERLGKRGQPGVDVLSAIHMFDLPGPFPEDVMEETREIVRTFDPEKTSAEREDLSEMMIITIDPKGARDYDDAISLRRLKETDEGEWELGIHIADVSAFVSEGSLLDEEARKRGTSVYLPGSVIPMLPEILSNGLCSLQEGQPRLCKSVFMRYDREGKVLDTRFANSVIRSKKRLTYRDATAIIDGKKTTVDKEIKQLLLDMDKLAHTIHRRRIGQGMLELDLPSVDLILDDSGRAVDTRPEDHSYSHKMIEMFMVEANEAVARLFEGLDVPFLRRIHPEPDEKSRLTLASVFKTAGMSVSKKGAITPRILQKLLKRISGTPDACAGNLAVLKSMGMAEYSPQAMQHFALASEAYTHFTSPIRRYPDLMIHRLLDLFLARKLLLRKRGQRTSELSAAVPSGNTLAQAGQEMSRLARRAEAAERDLRDVKLLGLIREQTGETFTGTITAVTNFGMFVQHPRYLLEGLLRYEDLGNDWWEADTVRGRVVGRRTRQQFVLGGAIDVKIASVDLAARKLELQPLKKVVTGHRKGTGKKKHAHRGSGRKRPGRGKRRGRK